MEHDAKQIDNREFLSMGYKHCLLYISIFFEVGEAEIFNIGDNFTGEYGKEAIDKFHAMVKRGYISRHGTTKNPIYSITPSGIKLLKKC